MVNKPGLQIIGWLFGGTTALVMLVAVLLVSDAVVSNRAVADAPATVAAEIR